MRGPNTRRTFLKVATTVGGFSAINIGTAQEDDDIDIELGGNQSGWEGVSPEEIEGETNPTLELVDGEDYVLEWENLDGVGHNFVIEDEDGEDLVETDIISDGTQTVEFTASEEMAEYYCTPHPTTMRGDIEIVADEETDDEETDDEEIEEFAAEVAELYELRLDEDGWHGEYPEEIEDEMNPPIHVTPGQAVVISFTNEVGDDDEENDGEGNNLQILDEDDEVIASTSMIEPGERGAVVFVTGEVFTAYRDETSGEEGEIQMGM